MSSYDHFITQNTAPPGARVIDVCDAGGGLVGQIPLGGLKSKVKGKKLYTCMMLADPHIGYSDKGNTYFAETMRYYGEHDEIDFLCIDGDIVHGVEDENGNFKATDESQWIIYDESIKTYANGKPVHSATGNHETYRTSGEFVTKYTGNGHYFLKFIGDDVFIFLNCYGYIHPSWDSYYQYYTQYTRDALYRVFERYRNKRCFVFQHAPTLPKIVDEDIDGRACLPIPVWQHYKNGMQFYGHRHHGVAYQQSVPDANYSTALGFKQIHVPTLVDTGQFFVVDVYREGLNIRTIDINTERPVPIGCFWIDTTLVEIPAGGWNTDKE